MAVARLCRRQSPVLDHEDSFNIRGFLIGFSITVGYLRFPSTNHSADYGTKNDSQEKYSNDNKDDPERKTPAHFLPALLLELFFETTA